MRLKERLSDEISDRAKFEVVGLRGHVDHDRQHIWWLFGGCGGRFLSLAVAADFHHRTIFEPNVHAQIRSVSGKHPGVKGFRNGY